MSISNPSPICVVKNGSGSFQATTNGVNVTAGNTVTIALADAAGVSQWNLSCLYTDETNSAATISGLLSVNLTTKTATFTAPSSLGSSFIFQSKVNNGYDLNGQAQPGYTTTFKIAILTLAGLRVAAFNETTEDNASYGWSGMFNNMVRNFSTTFDVNATPATSPIRDGYGQINLSSDGGTHSCTFGQGITSSSIINLVAHDNLGLYGEPVYVATSATGKINFSFNGTDRMRFSYDTVGSQGVIDLRTTGLIQASDTVNITGTNLVSLNGSIISVTAGSGALNLDGTPVTITSTGNISIDADNLISISGGVTVNDSSGIGIVFNATGGGTFTVNASSGMIMNGGVVFSEGGTKLSISSTGLGFYTATPVAQASRAGQLTGTFGSTGTAISDVGASFNQSTLNNNFRVLRDAYNKIETIIHNLGLSA